MARKKSTPTNKANGRRRTDAKTKATRGGTGSKRSGTRRATGGRSTASKTNSRSRNTPRHFSLNLPQKALILGIGVIFLTAVLVLSLLSPNQGQLTSGLADFLWSLFGWGGVVVPVITGSLGLYMVLWGMEQPPELPLYRLSGLGLLFLVFEAFASMTAVARDNGLTNVWQVAEAQLGGGYVGALLAYSLAGLAGNVGAIFTLVIAGVAGAVLATGVTWAELVRFAQHTWVRLAPAESAEPEPTNRPIRINPGRQPTPTATQLPLIATEPKRETAVPASPATPEPRPARRLPQRTTAPNPPTSVPPSVPAPEPVIISNQRATQSWTLPALADVLEQGSDQELNNVAIREQVEIIEHTLESFGAPATVVEINQGPTITQFGVEPNFIEMRNGKRTKVKVGKIASLADDLALALAAHSIRIQAPVPGKGYVGIEVPNPAKALVSLRDVMEAPEFGKIRSPLRIGLGQNVAGQPIAADLAAMPHLLVAGTTGSGKSVCVNGIIACLLLQNTPDNLKLVMVDPKRVELTGYNGIPHLAAPVVVEMERVIGTLQWALREMDHRYKLFAEVGARNIADFNQRVRQHEKYEPLPYIVIIIDELADLMMLAPEDTERSVTRLAQMARATGIHMVIATQRPSVDVVTGLIKANFPARIAFAVASSTDSRVILDTTGAERLLGQGDMLFQSPDAAAPVRLQGCFVSDKELNKLIDYWKGARRFNLIPAETSITTRPRATEATRTGNGRPAAAPPSAEAPTRPASKPAEPSPRPTPARSAESPPRASIPEPETPAPAQQPLWEALQNLDEASSEPQYSDELMPEAIALVRKLNKASTSLLQRRFRIGYTRAARLIDLMEEQGIIGPPTGTSKAREVLSPDGTSTPSGDDSDEETAEQEGVA